ncbi:hypothetical protein Tco_0849506 [Tanacetum coccineum]
MHYQRIRKVKIQLHDGSSFILEDVRYVPGLKRSLISLGILEKKGYSVKMSMGILYKIMEGAQRNRETKDFWVSNDDTAVAQRQLEDKQPEEKTNTDCLMVSLLAKRVASNLLRVRTIASSSRFFSCQGYQYVRHDSKGACILKFDDKNASSLVRGVVNGAYI